MLIYKSLFSLIAITLTFYAFIPYIRSIRSGKTRPHIFSWIIWGCVTFIIFLAQLSDHGGIGAWPVGFSGIITIYVAVLAYRYKADITINTLDWFFLVSALTTLPLWYLTSSPLWAVIILTTIDTIGFGPTLRKSWYYPQQENLLFYSLFIIRNLFVIIALENYSITTLLFPVVTAITCLILVLTVCYRSKTYLRE